MGPRAKRAEAPSTSSRGDLIFSGSRPSPPGPDKFRRRVCRPVPARRQVEWLLKERDKGRTISPLSLATIYTMLGEKDQAFAWLGKAIDERTSSIAQLKVEPAMGDLHSDARFAKMLQRINL